MFNLNDKMILELPGHQLIQHFMEEDRVQRIKIYQPQFKGNFKVEVISEKGKTTFLNLQAKEWQILTHRALLDLDQDFPSRPLLLRSHTFIVKLQENDYKLSIIAKALVGGGNASSTPSAERFVGLDWKARIAMELKDIPVLQDSPVPLTSSQQKQIDSKLLKAVKAKNYANVLKFLNQGANPNNYIVTIIEGESRRQSIFFEAVERRCSVAIVNLLAARFCRHQDRCGIPALARLLEAEDLYLSTIQLLLSKGESPDENYSIKTIGTPADNGYNVYIAAKYKNNFKAMQLLIESPRFNPNVIYQNLKKTLFLMTFDSGLNQQESMIFEDLAILILQRGGVILQDIDDFDNPLIRSALVGWQKIGPLLLEKSMNPSARQDPKDMSALQIAIFKKSEDLAKALLAYGADVNYCTYWDYNVNRMKPYDPLEEAQKRGWTEVVEMIAQRRGTGMIAPTLPLSQIPMTQPQPGYASTGIYPTQPNMSQESSSGSNVSHGAISAATDSQASSSASSADSSPAKQQPISWQQPAATSSAPHYAINGMPPVQTSAQSSQLAASPQQYTMNPTQPYSMNGSQQSHYGSMMQKATHDVY